MLDAVLRSLPSTHPGNPIASQTCTSEHRNILPETQGRQSAAGGFHDFQEEGEEENLEWKRMEYDSAGQAGV